MTPTNLALGYFLVTSPTNPYTSGRLPEYGSDPVGDAHINFHFRYYWYAIIFLVFDIAFMFLAFGGILVIQEGAVSIYSSLATLTVFIFLMGAGVWHVFRKRGRIYI